MGIVAFEIEGDRYRTRYCCHSPGDSDSATPQRPHLQTKNTVDLDEDFGKAP